MNTIYQWAITGIILIAAEMLVGNFVLLLFGLAALVVAGLQLILGEQSLLHNSLIFAVVGVIGTLWLRKKKFFQKQGKTFSSENEFFLDKSISSKAAETVKYQGTVWTAVNENECSLALGQKVKVVRTEGNRIFIDKV